MKKLLATALFLSASMNAYAADTGALLGGALGGAAGAAVGYNMGGQDGAILGAAIGGATGVAIGSQPAAPQQVTVVQGGDGERHDNGRHRGHRNKRERDHERGD